MFKISGDPALVSKWQNLITAFAKRPFNFGGYSSIDDILDNLGVDVILESDIVYTRGVPKELEDAEKFWKEEYRKLYEESCGTNNDKIRKDWQIAERNLGMARQSIYFWGKMPLRGCYIPDENVIKLYPEEIHTEYGGMRMEELIVSTLAHETMHAYFNRPGHNNYPYAVLVEEPLAEFGMLLYLKETNCVFYDWAKADVASKKTCYRYGANLMDQHLSAGQSSSLRKYLEDYKIMLPFYSVPEININNGVEVVSLPNGDGLSSSQVQIDIPVAGSSTTILPHWRDVFTYPPRYFYDAATKTLGLDGNWNVVHRGKILDIHIHLLLDVDKRLIDHLYLGDNYIADSIPYELEEYEDEVSVSPNNPNFYAKNGVLFGRKDNKPCLRSCGDGLYEIFRNGKWGVIDDQLNQVIPNKYDSIWSFDKNDLIIVRIDSHLGLVNKQGIEQVPPIYDHITLNKDGYYTVKQNGCEFRIDKDGNVIE